MKRASWLLPLLALALASPAQAYVRESSNWDPSTLPIPYHVNTSSAPSSLGASTARSAVDAGFTTWSGPSCTAWQATNAGDTSGGANSGDRQNNILWVSGSWPSELGDVRSVIGVTTPVWYSGGYFSDADIRFNNVGFTWSTTGAGGTVDAQSIATHEEGHFLGLDHPPVSSAIMYASYSGGIKRTLASDDTMGVCAIYPSGSTPPPTTDAGTPPPSSDACSVYNGDCATCTMYSPCGFCPGTSSCVSGSASGPRTGSCSGWAWTGDMCPAAGPGMGRLGAPCTMATDCSSSLCVGDGSGHGFCTRACTDDCGCPDGYSCFATTDPTLKVCAPGTRMCTAPPPTPIDAGTPPPPPRRVDAGTTPPPVTSDAGSTPPPPVQNDASTPTPNPTVDAGTGAASRTGCGCSAPGRSAPTHLLWLAALAPLWIARRRRR